MFELLKSEWAFCAGAFVTLLFIIDPFTTIPIYMTLTDRFGADDRRFISRKATLIAGAVLIFFAVSGQKFFELFGITLPAFQIAGGILLLIFGVSQLSTDRHKVSKAEENEGLRRDDISVFPLATPLMAGPGAISAVILLSTTTKSLLRLGELLAVIAACMVVVYAVLRASNLLYKILGKTGLNLLSRIMGIVLTAVAVQFAIDGVKGVLTGLHG